MGISLNYTAELKSPKLLPELLKEVKALAKEAGWKIKRIKPETFKVPDMKPLQVEGVLLNIHPECELVNLVFDSKGRMASYQWLKLCRSFEKDARIFEMAKQAQVMLIGPGGQMQKKNLWSMVEMDVGVRYAGTKTQFAGPAVHITVCKLLRYLAKKYFKSIDVSDDSDYWETGEVEKLVERMNVTNAAIGRIQSFFETREAESENEDDSVDDLLGDLRKFWKRAAKSLPHKGRKDD